MSTVSGGENPQIVTRTYITQSPTTTGVGASNNNSHLMGKAHGHYVHSGLMHESTGDSFTIADSTLPRLQPAVASTYWANKAHVLSKKILDELSTPLVRALKLSRSVNDPAQYSLRDASTMMDTPDGTRAISAFLCLKGIRSQALTLADHEESRLQHLEHWTNMDFVRRLTIDCGEVGIKEGVTDIEAATREIVRLINQGGAKNASTGTASSLSPLATADAISSPREKLFNRTLEHTLDIGSALLFIQQFRVQVVATFVHGWTTVRVNHNTNLNSSLVTVGDSETFGVNPTKLPVRTCTLRLCLSTNTVGRLLLLPHCVNTPYKKKQMMYSVAMVTSTYEITTCQIPKGERMQKEVYRLSTVAV